MSETMSFSFNIGDTVIEWTKGEESKAKVVKKATKGKRRKRQALTQQEQESLDAMEPRRYRDTEERGAKLPQFYRSIPFRKETILFGERGEEPDVYGSRLFFARKRRANIEKRLIALKLFYTKYSKHEELKAKHKHRCYGVITAMSMSKGKDRISLREMLIEAVEKKESASEWRIIEFYKGICQGIMYAEWLFTPLRTIPETLIGIDSNRFGIVPVFYR